MILFPPALQAPAPIPTPEPAPLPFTSLKAQYKWSFRGAKDSGSGSLELSLEPKPGKLVLEIHSYGERIALVDGDAVAGYQLVLPRDNINRTFPNMQDLPLPFLPKTGSVEALARALSLGEGGGLSVETRDDKGPIRLHYQGQDDAGASVDILLTRKRWEPVK